MFLESQDMVGESCPSQFDSQALLMMTPELFRLPVDGSVDFLCNNGAHAWLQRAHIQPDEAAPARRATREWKNRDSQPFKPRPSVSAVALARKRKRNVWNGKRQSVDSDSSDNLNHGDGERESLDMEEQLTAFVEYDATDMDSLEINPSQDFDGDEEEEAATQGSQQIQSSSWEDITDVNEYQDEASECFNNVIYAPQSASIPSAGNTSIQGRRECFHSVLLPKVAAVPEHGPLSDDSEGSLSDGFDLAVNLASTVQPALQPATSSMRASSTSPDMASKIQWRQRRSIKRDCSMMDNSSNYPANERLLLTAPSAPAIASESSSDRVIELKDGCFDSSDDARKVSMWRNELSCSVLSSLPDTMTPVSLSLNDPLRVPIGFQSRLARKRRKIGQLTLDSFFRLKTN